MASVVGVSSILLGDGQTRWDWMRKYPECKYAYESNWAGDIACQPGGQNVSENLYHGWDCYHQQ